MSPAQDASPFRRGNAITWRCRVRIDGTRADHPSFLAAMTVVHDTPAEVAVFRQPGHPIKRRNAEHGGPAEFRHRPVVGWRDGWTDEVWGRWRVLVLKRPADEHAISLFWDDASDTLDCWYIDLTSPLRRTATGFDFVENGLDVVVEPDLSSWRWKDADELAWAVESGLYSQAEAEALYAEGERAVERLYRERQRFDALRSWRPDPGWPIASVPAGWDAA